MGVQTGWSGEDAGRSRAVTLSTDCRSLSVRLLEGLVVLAPSQVRWAHKGAQPLGCGSVLLQQLLHTGNTRWRVAAPESRSSSGCLLSPTISSQPPRHALALAPPAIAAAPRPARTPTQPKPGRQANTHPRQSPSQASKQAGSTHVKVACEQLSIPHNDVSIDYIQST